MGDRLKKMLLFLIQLLPLGKDFILESHPDFSDNTLALYEYMLKKGVNKHHRIHWALHDEANSRQELPPNVDTFCIEAKGIRQKWKRFRALYFSCYIIDCNAYIHKRRKGQYRFHLGHGMPIKLTKEYLLPEKIGECDAYLVTAPFWIPIYVNHIGVPEKCLIALGYPRNDILSGTKKPDNNRYIMWLPTYRQHRRHPEQMERDTSGGDGHALQIFPYGMPEIESGEQLLTLNILLEEQNVKLYFRPHPVQDLSHFEQEELSHIILADDAFLAKNGISLYQMLAGALGLITDYSSVYYDFLLTERPIGLTIRDRDFYFDYYGCPFSDLKENIKGYYIESFEELLAFVGEVAAGHSPGQEDIRAMKARYHAFTDGGASERVYQYMEDNWLNV